MLGRSLLLILGKRTVVGYEGSTLDLPQLPVGLISCVPDGVVDKDVVFKYNSMYAKDYSIRTDWKWILTKWRDL